ncbi:hypothetical protein DM02DRAFT_620805 [Periconia macrospinosa]|uniref:Uncharacterized protein n=1 Tax=Periconia macrospinosa TaxID=97972 RepID=A0A2V1CYS8_9PLEO|nr:hypothetical protein DM02DRAFT_620805 [Periconia macrospinosa]
MDRTPDPPVNTGDSCHLFRLPQELRDQIYREVLYRPQGVSCLTLDCGATKFCRRRLVRPHRRLLDWLLRRPNLNLAVERAPITAYTITLDRIRKHPQHLTFARAENNQLKYVCRRLCYETRGLDLRCNRIFVTDTISSSAIRQSVLLLHRCSLLRQVTIVSSAEFFTAEYGQRNFTALVAHCSANPTLTVRVNIPYWSQASSYFLLLGLYLLSALRGNGVPMAQLARSTSVTYLADSVSELLATTTTEFPPNLRFAPREETFELDVFQRGLRQSPLWSLPCTRSVIGDATKLAQEWFRDGL